MNAQHQAQTTQQAPEITPAGRNLAPARAVPWKPVLAVSAAVAVAAVLSAGFQAHQAQPSIAAIPDRGEHLVDSDMVQLQQNREALESAGLASGTIYVRDYAAEDGDAVILNGARILLADRPTPLTVTPGPLILTAAAGSTGCVTVEIGDPSGVYQLCLRDGDPIRTRAR